MKSQIFRTSIPMCVVSRLLAAITEPSDHSYIITDDSYKRAIHLNVLNDFVEECFPHYHLSKLHFIQRMKDTPSFVNLIIILRQIYREHDLKYEKVLKYEKSSYKLVYKFQLIPLV